MGEPGVGTGHPRSRGPRSSLMAHLRKSVAADCDCSFLPVLERPNHPGLAEAAYVKRDATGSALDANTIAILADTLEDAGCNDTAILDHLRGPGQHVRCCWLMNLLLDKK
jgi:hypothetical protein